MIANLKNIKTHLTDKSQSLKNIKIVSFDIFDTLLIRKIDPPEEVKRIVSKNVVKEGLLNITEAELLSIRDKCEKNLRHKALESNLDTECSIREIMNSVTEELGVDKNLIEKLVDIEIKVEEALTSSMPGIKALLSQLKDQYKLIAVSDTYLPVDLIEKLLKSAGLRDYFDVIYCSCDYKLNKGSGRIFQKILEIEDVSTNQLIHIGDNPISDYLVPKKLGIESIQLYEEWNIKRRKFLQHLQNREEISEYWKGFSFVHKILSAEKSFDTDNSSKDEFYSWGRNTVGPLFTLYIHLVIKELEKENIQRLYFVARDGFLLQKIYEIVSDKLYGNSLNIPNYIYLSRYTSFISSIKNFSKRELDMSLFGENTTVHHVMERLGLGDREDIKSIFNRNHINPEKELNYLNLKKTIKNLLKDTEFNRIVLEHSRNMRSLLEKHLRQNNVFSSKDDKIALVDVGWLGTIQSCIEHTFSEQEDFPYIFGYYLALNPPLFDLSVKRKGLICDYRSSTPDERAMIFFREALEFPCRPDHGATVGYEELKDGTISPVFAENIDEKKIMPYIQSIQEGILDYTENYCLLMNIFDIAPEELKPYVVKNYNYKLGYPNKKIVSAFEKLSNADDFGSKKTRGIVRNFSILDFFNYTEFRKSLAEIPWKEGSLSKSRLPFIITCYNLAKRFICWNLTKFYYNEQNPE